MQIRAVARTFTLAVCAMFLAGDLSAQTIRSAVSGTILDGGPGAGSIANTYDQAGLNTGYVSGVTDFDTYLASNPTHTINFFGSEWFSNLGTSSASVLYDLGSVFFIDALALWNEETSGIGVLDLYGSVNGTNFFALALGLTPPDNPLGESYGATRFNFTATDLRYVRMDMTDCPQGQEQNAYEGCAIGEVAFRDAVRDGSVVTPEPVTMILMGTGLAGVAVVRRRRRTDDIA